MRKVHRISDSTNQKQLNYNSLKSWIERYMSNPGGLIVCEDINCKIEKCNNKSVITMTRGTWVTTLTWKTSWKSIKHIWLSQCCFKEKTHYLLYMNWMVPHLNKLESPSPKVAMWQVWLKLVQWFLRKILLNFVDVFLLFHNYLPLEKGGAYHLNKFKTPSS